MARQQTRPLLALALVLGLVMVWGRPADAAARLPSPHFSAPVCVNGFGVSFNGSVNWHGAPAGQMTVDWGDGSSNPLPSFPGWHSYTSAGPFTITLTATSTRGSGSTTTGVTVGTTSATCLYSIGPAPLAASGSLGPSQALTLTVKVTNAAGALVSTREPVWLSTLPAPGGGSISVAGQALTSTPAEFLTGISGPPGEVVATYTAPAALPAGGRDTVTVANAPGGASGVASTSYTFAPSVLPIAPPSTIPSDCSVDVSKALGPWMRNLPSDITVRPLPGACYRVDEGLGLNGPVGLTIDGGTFENLATTPPPPSGHGLQRGFPVFNIVGGSDVTVENLHIIGASPGGYLAAMAFAGGVELQGTNNPTVQNVTMDSLFGDGVTLAPLRGGPNHNNGTIKSPVTDASISNVTVNGAGRMGITFGSVSGAIVTSVSISNVGLDTFDVEADQGNEGSVNVTINGCTTTSAATSNYARTFFSNGGVGAGSRTGNITVANCTMTEPQGTAAIQVLRPATGTVARGPFLFENDTFSCGQSTSPKLVACVAVSGSNVTVQGSTFTFPAAPPAEAVYTITTSGTVAFTNDTVTGYGSLGTVDATSTVTTTGGLWTPAA